MDVDCLTACNVLKERYTWPWLNILRVNHPTCLEMFVCITNPISLPYCASVPPQREVTLSQVCQRWERVKAVHVTHSVVCK